MEMMMTWLILPKQWMRLPSRRNNSVTLSSVENVCWLLLSVFFSFVLCVRRGATDRRSNDFHAHKQFFFMKHITEDKGWWRSAYAWVLCQESTLSQSLRPLQTWHLSDECGHCRTTSLTPRQSSFCYKKTTWKTMSERKSWRVDPASWNGDRTSLWIHEKELMSLNVWHAISKVVLVTPAGSLTVTTRILITKLRTRTTRKDLVGRGSSQVMKWSVTNAVLWRFHSRVSEENVKKKPVRHFVGHHYQPVPFLLMILPFMRVVLLLRYAMPVQKVHV